MAVIPKVKEEQLNDISVNLNSIHWVFDDETDARVIAEAYSIRANSDGGFPIYIHTSNTDSEEYTLNITTDMAEIVSEGANGAFYGLQTLKQLLKENDGVVTCRTINDAPDMKYRGFYHDVTRGKVPTLETLKSLVDTMAEYKLNSLQLYIEHTFELKEYEHCREKLGYLTKDEIRELEQYCKSKFIELIPSIATFGHLYHLLSSDKYKHLSELPDYVPTSHYWKERMFHHTINPELDESFEVIKSIIDQYLEVTTSDKFNICCDETFDLGNCVNKGKDKARLYIEFVKKIAEYLISKGKTVMMWGDILLQHPECIVELPEDMIFLNWNYDKDPQEEQFEKIYKIGKRQILCPGTSSWNAFAEDVLIEEGNICTLAKYADKFNADGLLNTNWGDLGNFASITVSTYGLILGAAVSWNRAELDNMAMRKQVSQAVYGNDDFIDILADVSECKNVLNVYKMVTGTTEHVQYGCIANPTYEEYKEAVAKLKIILNKAEKLRYTDETVKREALNALGGFIVTAVICAKLDGFDFEYGFDFDEWLEEFSNLWLLRNKRSELDTAVSVLEQGRGIVSGDMATN